MTNLIMKDSGIPVSIVGNIAKTGDTRTYTDKAGKLVTEEVKPGYAYALLHHDDGRNELTLVKRSNIVEDRA
jgi:hypothetical protein